MTGVLGYCAGLAAEDIVAQNYTRRGFHLKAQRWRNSAGEIDLIMGRCDLTVFVEVKKSRDFATAAARLSKRQMRRIAAGADCYLAGTPDGLNTNARIDVALVDGSGAVEVLENAIGQ